MAHRAILVASALAAAAALLGCGASSEGTTVTPQQSAAKGSDMSVGSPSGAPAAAPAGGAGGGLRVSGPHHSGG